MAKTTAKAPQPIACPKCGGGVAYPTFADENGTNFRCLECEHGFTQPSSDDHLEGAAVIPESIAGPRTTGDPAVGSINADGSSFERLTPSKHADAGPGLKAEKGDEE